jgi:hypothetical protein
LQIASSVEKRIALAFPFFKMERLAIVMPTCLKGRGVRVSALEVRLPKQKSQSS